jgi:hypothetical protein
MCSIVVSEYEAALNYLLFTITILNFLLPARPAVASAATAAVTTSATTAAAIAAKAATTSTAAATAAAILAWPGFVDGQVTTTEVRAIKLFDSFFAIFFGGHFDKTEPPRTTRVAIFNH